MHRNDPFVSHSVLRLTPARLAVAAGLLALAGAAVAQDAPQPAPVEAPAPEAGTTVAALNLPQGPTQFLAPDPNVRRATAKVNGDIITDTDISQRVALVVAASDAKIGPEEMGRLRLQVLRNLIDETLQIQEAKAAEIDVDEAEVNQTFARVAQQNFGQNPAALDGYLTKIGSSAASLKRQIRGELAWQRLLRRNVQPFINVSDEEVNESLERLKAAKGTDEYRIGEIFLSATDDTKPAVFENGKKIVEQIKQGGSFVAYARQFSEASTAAVGGDLGWIRLAQLPTELATVAAQLGAGQLAGPVEVPGGFSILYLIDKRQVLTADPRDAVLSLKQITLTFPKGSTQASATPKVVEFSRGVKAIKGCGDAEAAATALGATVVGNDNIKVRDLPGPLQEAMLKLSLGETTPPFGSVEEGVRVLMLCGRDDPQAGAGPSFDELMSQMEDERVNKRAQTYLRDLRRDAVIEYN
ncbi:peptidylprolyl isomerase [Novosphingobium sp. Gsoil 351]|uniref:peptidylprolyl isomerase n=1 Tax=Novosphingobium sp. Gsoil 351 TaxID=2675225 RepID=UPI0012B48BD1|nr:peptidylprolyl isomerase [Novosphingobium sp. Gsoil 351]